MSDLQTAEQEARRARRVLDRPGARLIEEMGRYAVRTTADRRRRPACTLGRSAFAELARAGVLKPVGEGVWTLASGAPALIDPQATAGRPGFLEGERWWRRPTANSVPGG